MENSLNKYQFLNIEKIVQIFSYIQNKANVATKLELIKFLFFADRVNIRKHFSLISLDHYVALKYGPVASNALDILNKNTEFLSNFSNEELQYLNKIQKKNQSTRIITETNYDLLSKNEIRSLDFSIETFRGIDLVEISHDYPEWKRYKELFDSRMISSRPIKIDDFFTNPDIQDSPAIQKYFCGNDPLYEDDDYLNEAKKYYFEISGLADALF
jgi:hypothetical protein